MEECEGRHARGRICGGEERAADRWEGGDRGGGGRGQEAGGRVWSARVMVCNTLKVHHQINVSNMVFRFYFLRIN
jgi:hypothetical protein